MRKSGIYKLYWPPVGFYYIGQSVDVEYRIKGHKFAMRGNSKKCTQRMLEVYGLYGEPQSEVLHYCKPSELDHFEQYYIGLELNPELCINGTFAKPDKSVSIKLPRDEFNAISTLANGTKFQYNVKAYIYNLVKQHLYQQQVMRGE